MPYEYKSENHDWDLTLKSSWNLLMTGQFFENRIENKKEVQISCYTGAMLLSFCAIESFMNSIAFLMWRDEKIAYSNYIEEKRFWNKLEMICALLKISIDKGKGLFQVIEKMRIWRNSLVHSSPYSIDLTVIVDTKNSRVLHNKFQKMQYTRSITLNEAKNYYQTSLAFIDLIKHSSGLDPRATSTYKVL